MAVVSFHSMLLRIRANSVCGASSCASSSSAGFKRRVVKRLDHLRDGGHHAIVRIFAMPLLRDT